MFKRNGNWSRYRTNPSSWEKENVRGFDRSGSEHARYSSSSLYQYLIYFITEDLQSKHLANDHPTLDGWSSSSLLVSDLAAQQNCIEKTHTEVKITLTAGNENYEKEAEEEELFSQHNLQSQLDAKESKSPSKTLSAAISLSTLENPSRQSSQSCKPSDSMTGFDCPESQADQFSLQRCRFCSLEMDISDIPNHEVTCGMLPKQCSHCLKRRKVIMQDYWYRSEHPFMI